MRVRNLRSRMPMAPQLQPWPFMCAAIVGFVLCAILGRVVSEMPTLKNEVRLNEFLNPMFHFYPTASLLKATALADLRPEQTLVLIGGNSNFNGQGQNPAELWTRRLQSELGDSFKVVNFATMGSKSADLAGVIFRIIEPNRPNTLLVLNSYSTMQGSFDGADDLSIPVPVPFTYVFWDAYYKRLIQGDIEFHRRIRSLQRSEFVEHANEFAEIHLAALIDSLSYARDLWTFLDYEFFFTVWIPLRREAPFISRKQVREPARTFLPLQERIATSGMDNETLMQNVRGHFQGVVSHDRAGKIVPIDANWNSFRSSHDNLFSSSQRKKTLLCLLWPSPYFVSKLDPKEQELLRYVIPNAVKELVGLGYRSIAIGENFDDEDYETSFHFVARGGYKVAHLVADEIETMAKHDFR